MAFLYHKFTRRLLLSLILIWSVISFWALNPFLLSRTLITLLGLLGLSFIWSEIAPLFLLIFLAFTTSYAFYGFFIQYNLPTWLTMISIFILFGYFFTYAEQRTGVLGNKRLIYLVLFALIILEIFLALSYFLINPLSQSLVIATASYLFTGFCFSILAKHENSQIGTYLWVATVVIILVLSSSSWSR